MGRTTETLSGVAATDPGITRDRPGDDRDADHAVDSDANSPVDSDADPGVDSDANPPVDSDASVATTDADGATARVDPVAVDAAVDPSYSAVDGPDDLVEYSRRYAERVVAATDLAVDLSLVSTWTVSRRAKRRAAAVKHVRIPSAEVDAPLDWADASERHADRLGRSRFGDLRECEVVLSWRAFQAFDEAEWRRTVRHELVHVEQFQATGRTGHGAVFRSRCADLDTTRHCPTFHTGRYRIRCRECGETVFDRCRECKTTRLARQPVASQRRSLRPSPCCGAYYDLVDVGSR